MKSLPFRIAGGTVVSSIVAVLALITPVPVGADAVDDQRARVEQITDQLEELERQADILAEDWAVATDELRELEGDVAAADERVTDQRAAVAELQEELSAVAVQAYMGAGNNGLGPIFTNSTEFNDELQRDELIRTALNTGTADSDDLDRELNELAEAQDNLESKRDAAEQKAEDVEDAKAATEDQKAEYQSARADAEEELGKLIKEEEERRARESYERMQREAEAAAAAAEAAATEAAATEAQAQAEAAQAQAQREANSVTPASGGNESSGGGNESSGGANNGSGGANNGAGGNNNNNNTNNDGGEAPAAPAATAAPATPAPAPQIPAASSRAGTAVNAAMTQLGVPWVFARSDPGVAFDCSGLTMWAWGTAGVSMAHQSRAQAASFPSVPSSQAKPGDLIFYYSPISHVGMYIGGGQMVHAPNSGSVVNVTTVNWGKVVTVARPG